MKLSNTRLFHSINVGDAPISGTKGEIRSSKSISFISDDATGVVGILDSTNVYHRAAFNLAAGGASKPGIVLGDGVGAFDVSVYRDDVRVLKTNSSITLSKDSDPRITLYGANTSSDTGRIDSRFSRGTVASPSAVTSGDYTFRQHGYGHDGTGYIESASIVFGTLGTIATNRVGGYIAFSVHPDSTSSIAELMRIKYTGVGIGVDPTTILDIRASAPVLKIKSSNDTVAEMLLDSGSTSDTKITLYQNGSINWSLGNDQSDSNSFKIGVAGTVGTASALKLFSNLDTRLFRYLGVGTDPSSVCHLYDTEASTNKEMLRIANAQPSSVDNGSSIYISGWLNNQSLILKEVARVYFVGSNQSAGLSEGQILFQTRSSDVLTTGMYLDDGLVVGPATGGDKGAGTLNVSGDLYKNNTAYTNPDYVLEHYYSGEVVKFKNNEGASSYKGLLPLKELEAHLRANFRLPGISDEGMGVFKRSDFVLEKLEELFLYVIELSKKMEV